MDESTSRSEAAPAGSLFPNTRWTRVSRLRADPSSADGQRALADLCQAYWYPLYAFARRKGQGMEDAQDLTQGFFAKIVQGSFFADARSSVGKLRSYLLTAFTRHMADEWDRARALKRGGGLEFVSLDFEDGERRYLAEPADKASVEQSYDRAWARSVLDQAGTALAQEAADGGKGDLFAVLSPLITGDGDGAAYEVLATTTGMSAEALRQAVRRWRVRFREVMRTVIADTLDAPSDAEVDAELRALRDVLLS
jgi:DNA-directed RNA polymerase specialized sigma24 family protein